MVKTVQNILQKRFTAFPSLEELELNEEDKYVVNEDKNSYQGRGMVENMLQLDLDSIGAVSVQDIDDAECTEGWETSNMILVHEQVCTSQRW